MIATMLPIVCLTLLSVDPESQKKEASYIAALKELRSAIPALSCQFEGTLSLPRKNMELDVTNTTTGVFYTRPDGSFLIDNYSRNVANLTLTRETMIGFSEVSTTLVYPQDQPRQGRITISKLNSGHRITFGTYSQAICMDWMLSLLSYSNRRVKFLGFEKIDGARCDVVEVTVGAKGDSDVPKGGTKNRFWIDLGCHGQPRKVRQLDASNNIHAEFQISNFREFFFQGKKIQLPLTAKYESFTSFDATTRVANIENNAVESAFVVLLPNTLKLEDNFPNSMFTPKFVEGLAVIDNIKNTTHEYSQTVKSKPKEAHLSTKQTLLDLEEKLALADAQAKDLLVVKEPSSWMELSWVSVPALLFTTAVVSFAIVVVIKIRRKS